MKAVTRTLWAIIAFSAVIGLTLYANGYPPERVTGVAWKDTGYAVITSPLFFAVMAALMGIPIFLRKRHALDDPPSKARNAVAISILMGPAFMLLTQILFTVETLALISDPTGDILVLIGAGVMFALIGNYMSVIPYKAKIGLKTRWTLADPVIWSKTHRFLGKYVVLTVFIVTPVAALIDRENALMILVVAYAAVFVAALVYARMIGRDRFMSGAN